jgi:hypothetical protein
MERTEAVILIARLGHALRRELQIAGKEPQVSPEWDQALADPACAWMIEDSIANAEALLSGPPASPEQEHDRWMAGKIRQGYVWGEVKNTDPAAGPLTHPCLVPYEELPVLQRLKDAVVAGAQTAAGSVLLTPDVLGSL